MSERSTDSAIDRLRKQAERAIAAAQGRRVVEPLLERIVSLAPDGSEASVFAHRHLAEYRIEDHPWRALLHLRKVVVSHPDDDVVHALMGLSHALLANFRAAVSSYRRALAIAPRNPWYHHNLGHLLDVALDQPAAALKHLELAHRAAHPPEHEIAASLAHCMARLGRIDEAREMASSAVASDPRNREHKQLLAWIERGAPEEGGDPRTKRAPGVDRGASVDRGSVDRGSADRGSADRGSVDRGSVDRRSADRRSPDRASGPRAGSDRSSGDRASEERSGAARSSAERSSAERSSAADRGSSADRASDRSVTADRSAGVVGDRPDRTREPRARTPRARERASERDRGARDREAGGRVEETRARTEPGVRMRLDLGDDPVIVTLERVMREGGFTPEHVARARRLWSDYRSEQIGRRDGSMRVQKPDVCAAAIEYAIARLHGLDGVTRASVARRYGVSARSVSERFDDIQVVLSLKPDDPRYARC